MHQIVGIVNILSDFQCQLYAIRNRGGNRLHVVGCNVRGVWRRLTVYVYVKS